MSDNKLPNGKKIPEYLLKILRYMDHGEEDNSGFDERYYMRSKKENLKQVVLYEFGYRWDDKIFQWLKDLGFKVE